MALNADGPPMGVGRLKSLHVKRALPRGKVNFCIGRLDKAGLVRDLALGVLKDSGLERDSKPDTAASGPGLAWGADLSAKETGFHRGVSESVLAMDG